MHGVQSKGIDINLFLLIVPFDIGIQGSHFPFFKLEVRDHNISFGFRCVEERGQIGLAVDIAGEVHGMEVDKVEDILDIDIVEVYNNGIFPIG